MTPSPCCASLPPSFLLLQFTLRGPLDRAQRKGDGGLRLGSLTYCLGFPSKGREEGAAAGEETEQKQQHKLSVHVRLHKKYGNITLQIVIFNVLIGVAAATTTTAQQQQHNNSNSNNSYSYRNNNSRISSSINYQSMCNKKYGKITLQRVKINVLSCALSCGRSYSCVCVLACDLASLPHICILWMSGMSA